MSKPLLDVVTTSHVVDHDKSPPSRSNRPSEPSSPVAGKNRIRINHACDRCRVLKAKCSGGTRCARCTKDGAACQYSDRRREKIKRFNNEHAQQLLDLQRERIMLLAVLKKVTSSPTFQPEEHPDVLALLAKASDETLSPSSSLAAGATRQSTGQNTSVTAPVKQSQGSGSQSTASHTVGSSGQGPELVFGTNLNSGAGMAGYIGKMSAISWVHRVRDYLLSEVPLAWSEMTAAHVHDHPVHTLELTYFMDDRDLLSVDEDYVDQFQLPTLSTAMMLTEAYFHALQGAFQFVDRGSFLRRLVEIMSGRQSIWENRRFLSVANVMWATGAKWLELAQLDQQNIAEEHQIYYARARALGLDHRIQIDHPDVEMVQGLCILAFYLMINGSIQRAWAMLGQATRHAIALGLHIIVASGTISASESKNRAMVCYSMYRLEILISEITGRPNCLQGEQIQLPRPLVLEWNRESECAIPATGAMGHIDVVTNAHWLWTTFLQTVLDPVDALNCRLSPPDNFGLLDPKSIYEQFISGLELSFLRDRIGARLYLNPTDMTWADMQGTVTELEAELKKWHSSLAAELSMESVREINPDSRAQVELEMYHCSVQMILYRPALCEIHTAGESAQSRQFNYVTARACVQAAMRMLDLIPHNPVASRVVQFLPWWSLLHYICQATAVLLLELCLGVQHVEEGSLEIVVATRKAVNYLWCLSSSSKSAYKAWSILGTLFNRVLLRFGSSMLGDDAADAPRPEDWNEADQMILTGAMSFVQ